MQAPQFSKKTIPSHESIGERFKAARRKKQVSLAFAEHETKIRGHYLEAIEDGSFDTLPPSHAKGFIRRYAAYLGIKPETIERDLACVRIHEQQQAFSPRLLNRESRWIVTPKTIATSFSLVVLLGFIGYVTFQIRQFAAPPSLEITKPNSESVALSEQFSIEGQTEPGAVVYVDNLQATTGTDGTFSYLVTLRPGLNQITVRAENRIKKQTAKVVSVLFQAEGATPAPAATPSQEQFSWNR